MDYYIEHFEEVNVQILIKNFNFLKLCFQVWNDCRFKILNLEIKDLTSILFSEKLKNTSQKTVLHVIHDWVIANKKKSFKAFAKVAQRKSTF